MQLYLLSQNMNTQYRQGQCRSLHQLATCSFDVRAVANYMHLQPATGWYMYAASHMKSQWLYFLKVFLSFEAGSATSTCMQHVLVVPGSRIGLFRPFVVHVASRAWAAC